MYPEFVSFGLMTATNLNSTASNEACCAFFALRDDLQNNLFANECGEEVRGMLRLTFHDGIAISPAMEAQGKFGYVEVITK